MHFEEESAVVNLYKVRLGKRDAFGACHPSVMIVSGLLQVRLNRKAKDQAADSSRFFHERSLLQLRNFATGTWASYWTDKASIEALASSSRPMRSSQAVAGYTQDCGLVTPHLTARSFSGELMASSSLTSLSQPVTRAQTPSTAGGGRPEWHLRAAAVADLPEGGEEFSSMPSSSMASMSSRFRRVSTRGWLILGTGGRSGDAPVEIIRRS